VLSSPRGLPRLWRKSQTAEAKLCYLGHVVTENRHGLLVNVRVTQAYGQAEREAALGAGDSWRQQAGDAGGGSGL
jgi:hypothetical protein